ncbi:tyrosine-type recombinase/integrase [Pectobacterium aroidearum]|uniref:tyrosine-type recombinase/integrase n=1 Tax=Pectobacterium aroidearum TaxID=1201031 RepID=UPI001CD2975A|nr:site-specific integrase [Pectobacterium aroidearum]
MSNISTNTFLMDNGERYCIVIDNSSGIPLFYPLLYITTQLRNRSDSISTIELHAGAIALFYRFIHEKNINIDERILSGEFLDNHELDAMRDYVEKRVKKTKVVQHNRNQSTVNSGTKYLRLTAIANYLEWLSNHMCKDIKTRGNKINVFIKKIKSRRPKIKYRNQNIDMDKSLNQQQLDLLFEIIRVGSDANPFLKDVQGRNRLIILILYSLGLRAGELLNIKITDIDFSNHTLSIRRRSDEKSDPRIRQPLVKTLERKLPISEKLVKEIHSYILKERRKHKPVKDHGYLFITHKSGSTCGQPLSKQGYHKIIHVVRLVSPDLYKLTGHKFRHTWNFEFSKKMDTMDIPVSEEQQEQMRSYLMGWNQGSGTARIYNRRFIERKADDVALKLQNGIN